ncbi:MAG: histidine kinase N-terminal 7TM domain-containing protein [Patescibacteria group bacterium]|jgi:hypothetical protein
MFIATSSIILLISFICTLTVGVYTLYKGIKQPANKIFSLLILQAAIWILVNFFSFTLTNVTLMFLFTQLTLMSVLFIPSTYYYFVSKFIDKKIPKLTTLFLWVPPVIMTMFIFTPNNIKGLTDAPGHFIPGVLYSIYTVYFLLLLGSATIKLFIFYKTTQNIIKRYQAVYILIGSLITALISINTNAILPTFGINTLNNYGTSSSLVFSFCCAYAITRYRLLGITFILKKWTIELWRDLVILGLTLLTLFISLALLNIDIISFLAASIWLFIVITVLLVLLFSRLVNWFLIAYNMTGDTEITIPDALIYAQPTQQAVDNVFNHLQTVLRDNYGIMEPIFCLMDWKQKRFQAVKTTGLIWFKHSHALIQFAKTRDVLIVADEINNPNTKLAPDLRTEINKFMQKHRLAFALALTTPMDVYGFVLIKTTEPSRFKLYSQNNISELTTLSKQAGQLLQQILMHDAIVFNQSLTNT